MSSGEFTIAKYESNSGRIYPAKVQPETLLATLGGSVNAVPAGAVDQEVSAKMTGGRREYGVNARTVSIKWDDGGAPDGYDERSLVRIPVMTPAVFNPLARGQAVSYLGGSGTVAGKSSESVG